MKRVIGMFLFAVWLITVLTACGGGGTDAQLDEPVVNPSGVVTTIAGPVGGVGYSDGTGASVHFRYPDEITTDGTNLYVADTYNHTIRKIVIATGVVSTLAGSAGIPGSADGTGGSALFYHPHGITTDGTNLYVADSVNHTIRKIVIATGVVSTLAGSAGVSGSSDGTGALSLFRDPWSITTDGVNLYIADTNNYTIRKIVIATGVVSTLAGLAGISGSADGAGSSARFGGPQGITTDGTNLYVADTSNNTIRHVVIATGVVSTLAGSAEISGSADGTGSSARFFSPGGITTVGANLFVVDTDNQIIRKIVIATALVSTLAGSAGGSDSDDGIGSSARFFSPSGITSDGANLYVADTNNHTIRKIAIGTGVITTLAGSAGISGSDDGTGSSSRFYHPHGITTDGANLFVADAFNSTIRKIVIATGVVSTLAGSAGVYGSDDGTGSSALFGRPHGITTDGANLYVADIYGSNIRKIVIATGVVSTLAGSAGIPGSSDGAGGVARFYYPCGITTDGTNLFVTDTYNYTIRKIVIATGVVSTLAGSVGVYGSDDGTGTSALFWYPQGITTDGTNLYVADTSNHTIRKIVIATGVVSTLAGFALHGGTDDGTGTSARFDNPYGITNYGVNLYVADTDNHRIRKVTK